MTSLVWLSGLRLPLLQSDIPTEEPLRSLRGCVLPAYFFVLNLGCLPWAPSFHIPQPVIASAGRWSLLGWDRCCLCTPRHSPGPCNCCCLQPPRAMPGSPQIGFLERGQEMITKARGKNQIVSRVYFASLLHCFNSIIQLNNGYASISQMFLPISVYSSK